MKTETLTNDPVTPSLTVYCPPCNPISHWQQSQTPAGTELTHIYAQRFYFTLNTLMRKAFPFLQTVACFKKQQGEILIHLSLNKGNPSSEV